MHAKATTAARNISATKDRTKKKGGWRKYRGLLFGLFLLAGVIYVAMHVGEGHEFLRLIRHANPIWLGIGVLYQAATYVASGAIWWIVVRHFKVDISLGELSALSLAKLSLEKIIPSGGFGGSLLLVRSVEGRGAPECAAAATLLVDVLSIYTARAISIVIAVAIIWADQGVNWLVVLMCAVFILFAAAVLGGIFWFTSVGPEKIPRFLLKIPAVGPVIESISEAPPEAMRSKRLFWGATGLQLLILILDAATLDAMLRSIGHSAGPDKIFASFSIAGVASVLSIIPGGIGAFEGVSILMLSLLKVPIKAGLAATLMLRAFILWLPMIPGFFVLRRESKHLVKDGD
jgi:glycosyltransferase 2 family protein